MLKAIEKRQYTVAIEITEDNIKGQSGLYNAVEVWQCEEFTGNHTPSVDDGTAHTSITMVRITIHFIDIVLSIKLHIIIK